MSLPLWLPLAGLPVGLACLVWGADRFVDGASATARRLGLSPLLTGLVVVGFATSAPEVLASAIAAWDGRPDLAIGNAVGSNIVNIALVLGLVALIRPFTLSPGLLRREVPVALAAVLLALALMADGHLGRGDGLLLLAAFGALLYGVLRPALRERTAPGSGPDAPDGPDVPDAGTAYVPLVLGLAALLAGSRLLVWSAERIAEAWGGGDLVVGLTLVALGTSLPELAASTAAALKGRPDMAIGNIIGSNIFNVLGVIGLAGAIHPGPFDAHVLIRDFPVMLGLTLVLLVKAWGPGRPGRIGRPEGLLLLAAFAAYLALLLRTTPPA